MVLVGDLKQDLGWAVWVRTESRLKQSSDLRGTKIAISRTGSGSHAFGTALARSLGLEKEIEFVAAGGLLQQFAALRARTVNGIVTPRTAIMKLVARGEARELVGVSEYLPKPWISRSLFAIRGFMKENPDTVKQMVRGMLGAHQFILTNPSWSIERLMAEYGYSRKLAEQFYKTVNWRTDGRIDRTAVQNVVNFLVKYRLAKKKEIPPLAILFTNRFID